MTIMAEIVRYRLNKGQEAILEAEVLLKHGIGIQALTVRTMLVFMLLAACCY